MMADAEDFLERGDPVPLEHHDAGGVNVLPNNREARRTVRPFTAEHIAKTVAKYYDELFEAVERVNPRKIYCTHGPASFVDCLRAAGHNAFPLEPPQGKPLAPVQRQLF